MQMISRQDPFIQEINLHPSAERTFFSVYQTGQGIEVRPGCSDYINTRLVGSYASYEQAVYSAKNVALYKNLPLLDYA